MLQVKFLSKLINYSLSFLFFTNKLLTFFYLIKRYNILFFQSTISQLFSDNTIIDIILFGLLKGYKIYLQLYGAGFKIKLVDNTNRFGLILRIGKSHLIFIALLKNFRIKFFTKFMLCIYTNNLFYLHQKLSSFDLRRKKNIYKKKGIF